METNITCFIQRSNLQVFGKERKNAYFSLDTNSQISHEACGKKEVYFVANALELEGK